MPSVQRRVRIFFSYAHEDKKWRNELAKHLGRSHIEGWHDRDILPGENWASKIDAYLETADIILLLISADFIASDYCYGKEMRRALERQRKGEAEVIPVILRPVNWQPEPFSYLQALPADGTPVTSWANTEQAFAKVAEDIRLIINTVLKKHYSLDGEKALAEDRYEDACFAYTEITKLFPGDAPAYKKLSDALLHLNRLQPALNMVEKAIDFDPHEASYYVSKARILSRQRQLEAVRDAYQQATNLGVMDPSVYQEKGDVLFELRNEQDALEAYNRAIVLFRQNPQQRQNHRLYVNKARILVNRRNWNEALQAYEQGILLSPRDPQLYMAKGDVQLRIEMYQKALEAYEHAITLEPQNAQFRRRKGQVHAHLGQFNLADAVYVEAIQLEKNNAYFYKEYGDILLELKRFAEAVAVYDKAISVQPNFAQAYAKKGDALELLAEQTASKLKRDAEEARARARELERNQKRQKGNNP